MGELDLRCEYDIPHDTYVFTIRVRREVLDRASPLKPSDFTLSTFALKRLAETAQEITKYMEGENGNARQ